MTIEYLRYLEYPRTNSLVCLHDNCNGKIILKIIFGLELGGPLHSGAPWTLPTPPYLPHCYATAAQQ